MSHVQHYSCNIVFLFPAFVRALPHEIREIACPFFRSFTSWLKPAEYPAGSKLAVGSCEIALLRVRPMLALLLAPSGLLSPTPVQPRAAARVSPAMSAPSSLRLSRRQLVPAVAAWAAASRFAPSARALENSKGPIWTSGRSDPIRPTSKDKADGTKKDPKYLSCLNDCVPQCSSTYGTDTGRPKERSDCFDECQDQCCATCASPR